MKSDLIVDADGPLSVAADVTDDEPGCTLLPPTAVSTCYCTRRAGCQREPDDDRCPYCYSTTCERDCDEAFAGEDGLL